jgi:hypothetical protein
MLLYVIIIITLILLLSLIGVSANKLIIYFDTFMFLSKKINYDKTNYISNSSFFKYHYSKKLFGYFGMQLMITIILFLLSTTAYLGYILKNQMNYGFLNKSYGDSVEYYLVNVFIYVTIIFTILYGGLYMYWYNYDIVEDLKLEEKENNLKKLLVENLDYDLLYDYFKLATIPTQTSYSLENYVIKIEKGYFKTPDNVFKYCLTYNILNDKPEQKFTYIKKELFDIIKQKVTLTTSMSDNIINIRKVLSEESGIYIIAKYNHNNNTALKPLEVIIDDLVLKLNSDDNKENREDLLRIKDEMKVYNETKIKEMINKYDEIQGVFMDTIKTYKEIYDKYYMYYTGSVLLTNFLIVYAIIIVIYIIMKICGNFSEYFEDNYNAYYLINYLNNYGIYILLLYYFITCPIIIFGFN